MSPSYKVAHTSWGGLEYYKSNYEILTNPGWVSHLEWKKSDGSSIPENAVVGGKDTGNSNRLKQVKLTVLQQGESNPNFLLWVTCPVAAMQKILRLL